MKLSILTIYAFVMTHFCLSGAERAFVESSSSQITYDPSGDVFSRNDARFVYDQHGSYLGSVFSSFASAKYFRVDYTYYVTNSQIAPPPGASYAFVVDSIAFTNGIAYESAHAVTTSYWTSNQSTVITDQITTYPDGHFDESISTIVDQVSSDYRRSLTEVRNTNGNLLSWSLFVLSNAPLHSIQFILYETGSTNETEPESIQKHTTTFDAFGDVLLSTFEFSGFGFTFLDVTSNSYVRGQDGRILSSVSKQDIDDDGTVDDETVSTFTYDKAGNLIARDDKSYGYDGRLRNEQVTSNTWDRFGNLLHQEAKQYNPDGSLAFSSISTDTYVPRGQSFDRPPAHQRMLDRFNPKFGMRENSTARTRPLVVR